MTDRLGLRDRKIERREEEEQRAGEEVVVGGQDPSRQEEAPTGPQRLDEACAAGCLLRTDAYERPVHLLPY
jgi:hypothetical protein